jgi:hypothetical protein
VSDTLDANAGDAVLFEVWTGLDPNGAEPVAVKFTMPDGSPLCMTFTADSAARFGQQLTMAALQVMAPCGGGFN